MSPYYLLNHGNSSTYRILAAVQVVSMTGSPRLFHVAEVMGWRVRSDRDTTTTLAVEPMMVPFPPKPAPKASAHHSGSVLIPAAPRSRITGIKAMVMGML